MDSITEYILTYGLPVFVIASCIIAIIGILKLCKVFDKIKSKNVKKFVYYVLNVALAFAGAAIYFAIFKRDFNQYLLFSASQVGATTTLYALYENFGIRKLLQTLGTAIKEWLKRNPENKFAKAAKSMGLSDDKIDELIKQVAESAPAPEKTHTPIESK